MTARAAAAALGAAAALAAAASGCGGTSGGGSTTTVQRTTRVEVLTPSGAVRATPGGFDAEAIYRRDGPGVVTILATHFPGAAGAAGLGSGFVIAADGEIATNAHVVTSGEGGAIRRAQDLYVRFGDGNQVSAKIVGYDPFADVALIRVDPTGLTLRPLPLGSSAAAHVGEPVAAIGSPFGEERSLSVGVISATDRDIESLTGFQTSGALQTDAAINSGNSGGPLLDAAGRVLGIDSQIRTTSGEGSGVGFAVPVDLVRHSIAALRRSGTVRYAYLGLSTQEVYPQLARRFALGTGTGAWIQSVVTGGPAARAGLRAGRGTASFQDQRWREGGDVIVAVGGQAVRHESDLSRALLGHDPGQTVAVTVLRDGRRRTVNVRLGARPLQSPRG